MKIYISNYRHHWISPYKILEKICFWVKDKDVFYNLEDKPDHPWEKWVDRVEYISKGLQWFLNKVHPRVEYVKIDRWDTWNMDGTLGLIILPMLKQLNKTKHGAPYVDDEDVPEELKSTSAPPKENEYDTDANHFKRWDWVLNEMIFAFEHLNDDTWKEQYHSGKMDKKTVACEWDENGKPTMYQWLDGPNHTYKYDYDGISAVEKRMDNGFRLFGKYYRNLWD